MSLFESLILGIIQGLTEFLPVSSSGHLEIFKEIFSSDYQPKESLLITITLHAATAMSTLFYFRKDIGFIFKELLRFEKSESLYFALKIILSMIPAVIVGLFFEDFIASLFDRNLLLVGFMLLITAFLLFQADRIGKNNKPLNYRSALLIGVIQAIAILPGISRSGATIALAVLLGIDRERAARFSFLMVIPLIFGSMAKSLLEIDSVTQSPDYLSLLVGFIAAFITGIFACKWMIALVKKSQLKYFSFYCIVVGVIAIVYAF
ncbi:undecaprenyl-diphosphate phosphatase [Flavobacteriaceae bacterium]|jgi:undecaprenyl-diphosphatase|nr:undecaprenyl-diphosphate phosphatase [Flavobacteriaceae bacterium]|tara:strand:- start:1782 stop:2570 length:789 start_codon:yes stop_codon:yes gene_type:complete